MLPSLRRVALAAVVVVTVLILTAPDGPWVAAFEIAAMLFVLLLGRAIEGWRNMIAFILITWLLAFIAEDLGVHTGVVFGAYQYSSNLGPMLDAVPMLVLIAYFTSGYVSLTLARLITGIGDVPRGWRIVGLAACAAMVMVGWDVAMDPSTSLIDGDWIWTKGGNYFGIPLHNYWGWFALNFLIYLVYLLFCAHRTTPKPSAEVVKRSLWYEAPIYWVSAAALIILAPLVGKGPSQYSALNVISPPTPIPVEQLRWILAVLAVFSMLGPTLFAVVRLGERTPLPFTGSLARVSASPLVREPAFWVIVVGIPAYVAAVYALGLQGGYAPL